jgi:hypothetical protein
MMQQSRVEEQLVKPFSVRWGVRGRQAWLDGERSQSFGHVLAQHVRTKLHDPDSMADVLFMYDSTLPSGPLLGMAPRVGIGRALCLVLFVVAVLFVLVTACVR